MQGLENHPELNGTMCTVLQYNKEKEVWAIKLDENGQQVGLHSENLTTDLDKPIGERLKKLKALGRTILQPKDRLFPEDGSQFLDEGTVSSRTSSYSSDLDGDD